MTDEWPPTAVVADACLRAGVELRAAPPGIAPVIPGQMVAGRVLPVVHYGSVDVFLEAYGTAAAGDVLVVDNGGRTDEACVGDLAVLEAGAAGLAGVVIWGLHRDTAELVEIGMPVFSYGRSPLGPVRLDPVEPGRPVRVGPHVLTPADLVLADADGVLFVPADRAEELRATAARIQAVEREQAAQVRAGRTLRDQTSFADYLARRATDPGYTFRRHLRRIGGAIEE